MRLIVVFTVLLTLSNTHLRYFAGYGIINVVDILQLQLKRVQQNCQRRRWKS